MTTYFVIRHKPTGTLLPARVCATHYEFDRLAGVHEPRLFNTERAAKNCATCWAQGTWQRSLETEQDGWGGPSYSYLSEPAPYTAPGRRRDDLEVIPAELKLLG